MLSLIETNSNHDSTTIKSKRKKTLEGRKWIRDRSEGVVKKKEEREEKKIKESESVVAKEKENKLHIT